jgi:LPS-assembly protein
LYLNLFEQPVKTEFFRKLIMGTGVFMLQRFWRAGVIIFFVVSIGMPLLSPKAEGQILGKFEVTKEPWNIEALEMSYDQDTDTYTAIGKVEIKKDGNILKCDFAQVDRSTMIAYARGKVELFAKGDELRGEELTVDLKKYTGELKKGRLYLKKNNFHIRGEEIYKTGPETYRVLRGTVTSCDGDNVPWAISAKEIVVTVDGYGQAWNPALQVKKIPVIYSPYLLFPAKVSRQTGFLMPEFSQSTRDGFSLNLPLYWVISDNADATFNEYFMSKRGLMQGAEFRYALSPQSKGALKVDYLFNDGSSQEEFNKGNINSPYSNRYWFRSKIDHQLPGQIDLKADLDWVSDRDFLKEFKTSPNGLDRNRKTFISDFNRDLEDETVLNRKNALLLAKNFGSSNLTGGFNYFQENDSLQNNLNQLPYARYDMTKQLLSKSFSENLFFQWGSSYNNYYRKNLDRGQVLELNPNFYYPVKVRNSLNLEGSVGLTETLYQVDNKQTGNVDSLGNRTVPNFRLDTSTDFQKIFDFSGAEIQKVKHNLRPQVLYNYIPDIKQDTLPSFVSPINKTNTVTYLLINTFTAKSLIPKARSESDRDKLLMGSREYQEDRSRDDLYGYLDFLRLQLSQTYDINEATKDISSSQERRPFSNVIGDMDIRPARFFNWRSSGSWSPYSGQVETHTHNLNWTDTKGNRAYVEYLSTSNDQIRQINSNVMWKIAPAWTISFLNKFSLDQNKNYETTAGLIYSQQCWGLKFTYTSTPDNLTYFLTFTLKGLAEF